MQLSLSHCVGIDVGVGVGVDAGSCLSILDSIPLCIGSMPR